QALPSVKQYFSFAIRLLLAFGLVFEMPVVVLFLTKIGLVTPDSLKKFRKFAILSSFILSAILTPPDVATQLMMALPIIILYEISIVLSKTMYRKKEKKPDTEET
ncbi:MAG: twin-arginine translocase subunit TatC, partial [Deltaproteobacteria bacterium]|nr:twin-arginine translocase subunit TatC [Deltaproteobacteria bacterium]